MSSYFLQSVAHVVDIPCPPINKSNIKNMGWKKLTQEQFIALSEQQVEDLNGASDKEEACQAWRDGYLYAMERIWRIYCGDECEGYNSEIMDALEQKLEERNLDYINDEKY